MQRLLNTLKKIFALCGMLCVTSSFAQPNLPAADKLRIGVVPNVSARIIAVNYQPMAEYFNNELKREKNISTGANFASFHQRALNQEFELMVTAPNLGRLAQTDGKWVPLAVFEPGVPGLLVGMSGRNNELSQLKGKKLALANPQSLVALVGIDWLKSQGYQVGKDYHTLSVANDDSLGVVLKSDEAPFAMMSMGEFNSKSAELKKMLTIVTQFVRLPGFLFMVGPHVNEADRLLLKQLIERFPQSEQGKKFLALNSFTGMTVPTEAQFALLDQYLEPTRKGIAIKK